MSRSVTILGATGSIGRSTAAVLEELGVGPDQAYGVEALTAGSDIAALVDMAVRLQPRFVAVADPGAGPALKDALAAAGVRAECAAGPRAIIEAALRPADWVMSAIVGAVALKPTLTALSRGATVAIANKECLVCGGALLRAAAAASGAQILPVDSEHNAIFQVLQGPEHVERVTLTASGGPFRTWSRERMEAACVADALKHPNWAMGAKNTIDSATLVNKGLELIEAAVLFDLTDAQLDVLVHPQSIVHALVAYRDGSVLSQLAAPDMRIPIAHALAWPARAPLSTPRLDLAAVGRLEFEAPDLERFPGLSLARRALRAGGGAPAVFNAANEVAVQAFLDGRARFLHIATAIERVLEEALARPHIGDNAVDVKQTPRSLDAIITIDTWARAAAADVVQRLSPA